MRDKAAVNFTMDDVKYIGCNTDAKKIKTLVTLNNSIVNHVLSVLKTVLATAKETIITLQSTNTL